MGSDPGHIGEHLAQLCDDIRGREPYLPDVLEQAVLIHHRAVQIHPFRNGNGRWSRMLSNIWLRIPRLPDRGMAGNDRRREPDSVGIPRLPPGRRRPRHQAAPRAPRPPPTRAQPTLTLCHRDVTGEEQSHFVFPQSMPPGSGFPRQASQPSGIRTASCEAARIPFARPSGVIGDGGGGRRMPRRRGRCRRARSPSALARRRN